MATDRVAGPGLEIWRARCDCCYSLLCLLMRELGEKPLKVRRQPIETMILAVEVTRISASF